MCVPSVRPRRRRPVRVPGRPAFHAVLPPCTRHKREEGGPDDPMRPAAARGSRPARRMRHRRRAGRTPVGRWKSADICPPFAGVSPWVISRGTLRRLGRLAVRRLPWMGPRWAAPPPGPPFPRGSLSPEGPSAAETQRALRRKNRSSCCSLLFLLFSAASAPLRRLRVFLAAAGRAVVNLPGRRGICAVAPKAFDDRRSVSCPARGPGSPLQPRSARRRVPPGRPQRAHTVPELNGRSGPHDPRSPCERSR